MAEYIDKQAAIAIIEEKQKELCPVGMYSRHSVYGSDREKFDAWEEIIEALEAISAADVRPVKRGKWTMHSDYPDRLICSECGTQFDAWHWEAKQMHFCPNCGAWMEES